MARFVVVVDTQVDFMAEDGALSVAGAQALVAPMAEWLEGLDPADTAGILFTFDTHDPLEYAGSAEADAFPIHCVRETPGWSNVLSLDGVDLAIPVWRIEKGVFDMWAQPGLTVGYARDPAGPRMDRDAFFEALETRGVKDVTVIGVAADYCVRWAMEGLLARGFRVSVAAALTRGIARQIDAVVRDDFGGAVCVVGN